MNTEDLLTLARGLTVSSGLGRPIAGVENAVFQTRLGKCAGLSTPSGSRHPDRNSVIIGGPSSTFGSMC